VKRAIETHEAIMSVACDECNEGKAEDTSITLSSLKSVQEKLILMDENIWVDDMGYHHLELGVAHYMEDTEYLVLAHVLGTTFVLWTPAAASTSSNWVVPATVVLNGEATAVWDIAGEDMLEKVYAITKHVVLINNHYYVIRDDQFNQKILNGKDALHESIIFHLTWAGPNLYNKTIQSPITFCGHWSTRSAMDASMYALDSYKNATCNTVDTTFVERNVIKIDMNPSRTNDQTTYMSPPSSKSFELFRPSFKDLIKNLLLAGVTRDIVCTCPNVGEIVCELLISLYNKCRLLSQYYMGRSIAFMSDAGVVLVTLSYPFIHIGQCRDICMLKKHAFTIIDSWIQMIRKSIPIAEVELLNIIRRKKERPRKKRLFNGVLIKQAFYHLYKGLILNEEEEECIISQILKGMDEPVYVCIYVCIYNTIYYSY
jgi:hypothetical protein